MRTLAALCVTAASLVAVVSNGLGGSTGGDRAAATHVPPQVSPSELKPEYDGKEVTMTFEVAETYAISGSVPIGSVPSFGLRPVLKEESTRFSVLVSGELADVMNRFNMGPGSGGTANGEKIEASGVITVFKPAKDAADQRVSYQLNIREWKKFCLLPRPKAAG